MSQASLTSPKETKAAILTSRSGNTSDNAELLDYISQHPREQPEPLSRLRVRRESRPRNPRPECNSQSPRKERASHSCSPVAEMPPKMQSSFMLSYFSIGANTCLRKCRAALCFLISRSGSVPIPESVWTTHPRILCRTELPASLQFPFELQVESKQAIGCLWNFAGLFFPLTAPYYM